MQRQEGARVSNLTVLTGIVNMEPSVDMLMCAVLVEGHTQPHDVARQKTLRWNAGSKEKFAGSYYLSLCIMLLFTLT